MAVVEEIKVTGGKLKDKVKEIIKEGNVRRLVIRNPQGRTLVDMPLNAGVAGVLILPGILVTIGSIVALAKDFTIVIERDSPGALTKVE